MFDPTRTRRILSLGLPVVAGMVSQHVLNLVDTAMVGTLGDIALAAVGIGSFLNFMSVAFIQGLSSGVQTIAARRKGEERLHEVAIPLNGAVVGAFLVCIPLSMLLSGGSATLFGWLTEDVAVREVGTSYFAVRVLGMTAIGINFSFRGFFNGVDLTRIYMRVLMVMHAINIFLNWVFIFGNLGSPVMGATGAGLASVIALYIGSLYYVFLGFKHGRDKGFLKRRCDRQTLAQLLRLSVPNGLQIFLFATGLVVLFWIIGLVGTLATAAANVLVNVMLVASLPGVAFGIAAMSLVGQAIGRGEPDDAYRWAWDVTRIAMMTLAVLGAVRALFPGAGLGIFLHNPETLELARVPLIIFGLGIVFDGVGSVMMQALLGAGAALPVMAVSVVWQWGVFLPFAYWVGPTLGYGLTGIWIVQTLYRCLQALVFGTLWKRKRWMALTL